MERDVQERIDYFLRYSAEVPTGEALRHKTFSRDCQCKPKVSFNKENCWHTIIHTSLRDPNINYFDIGSN